MVVECKALKPCCKGKKKMCVVIVLRNNEKGLLDEGSVVVMFGFSMGLILFLRYSAYCHALLYG